MCVRASLCVRTHRRMQRLKRLSLDPNLVPLRVLLSVGGVAHDPVPHKVQVLNDHHVGWGPPTPIPGLPCSVGRSRPPQVCRWGCSEAPPLWARQETGPASSALPSHRRTRRKGWRRLWRRGRPASKTSESRRLCLKPPLTGCGVAASEANKPLF